MLTTPTRRSESSVSQALLLGNLTLDLIEPSLRRHVRRRTPIPARGQRTTMRHLGPVGQRRALELAERVEPLHENLQPVPNLLERVGWSFVLGESRRPLATLGIAPRMPGQEGDLGRPIPVAQHMEE